MKRILFIISCLGLNLINSNEIKSQTCYDQYYCLSFYDTICRYHLSIDTTNTGNVWQIGIPQKPMLDSTACDTKALVTDSLNAYPVNNQSVFTITNLATSGDVYGFRMFSANYYVQTDSLHDFGKIELSLDKGINWIDIINDTTYNNHFFWYSAKPVLTGRSYVCKNFSVDLADLPSIHFFQIGDTMLFRFTFFSDSIFDNLSGLIFDDICFYDFVEGISETRFTSIWSKIYPNPSSGFFTIEFDNPEGKPFQLSVYDMQSRPMFTKEGITGNKIQLDMQKYDAGIYVYKITNVETKKRCWGRFSTVN